MRKTKIVCTLGPATEKEEVLRELIASGMNVARFNFSHGSYEEHMHKLKLLKRLRNELDLPVAALLDTKGPEIRIKKFKEERVMLEKGQTFTLTTKEVEGTKEIVSVTYKDLPKDLEIGSSVLIDDGLIAMKVIEKDDESVKCEVLNDGVVSNNKGVNLPGTDISMPFISEKDRQDIIFGAKNGFDFIAASFTRCADDVNQVRQILKENGGENLKIVAKIENLQGVNNIDEIIEAADAIMIARGDMGVEIPNEEVPVLQKKIIKQAYKSGTPVITATQMLDSMMKNPRPTRAETTDVANAIYDGTSAIMLSGETAAGKYPIEALKTMVRIAERTEQDIDYVRRFQFSELETEPDVTSAISHATCTTAHDLNAKAIITVTKSGRTALNISQFRPACPIMGCAMHPQVCRQLNLAWGVTPLHIREEEDTFILFDRAIKEVKNKGYVVDGDLTVITAGVPLGISGNSNLLKVQIVGETSEI